MRKKSVSTHDDLLVPGDDPKIPTVSAMSSTGSKVPIILTPNLELPDSDTSTHRRSFFRTGGSGGGGISSPRLSSATISVNKLAMETLKNLASQSSNKTKRRYYCCCCPITSTGIHRRRCVENRVTPTNQALLAQASGKHLLDAIESQHNAAFSYVAYDDLEGLTELLLTYPSAVHFTDERKRTLLHVAASKGNLRIAHVLVTNGARINEVDEHGNLPIHLALIKQNSTMAQYMLSVGIDPVRANNDGVQPIHLACEKNDTTVLGLLLQDSRVDINVEGDRGATPIHYCCNRDSVDCLKLLIEHGANVYAKDFEDAYPIHVAVTNISFDCAEALFATEKVLDDGEKSTRPATPSYYESRGRELTPSIGGLQPAQSHRSLSTVSGPEHSLDSVTGRKLAFLARSLRVDNVDVIQIPMIELVDCEGETPLHAAVTSGNADMVKLCLAKDANVLAKQNDDSTPIHYACIKDDIECLQLMLEAFPANKEKALRMADKNGYTPVHLAAVYNHDKLLAYLVEQGSQLELTDINGLTPLLLAAWKGAFQSCIRLLELDANPDAHDIKSRNLVHLLMLFRGPGVRTVLPAVKDKELIRRLMNEKDNFGSTPLHYSTRAGNLGATNAFIEHGASALERDNERDTPLHTAAFLGRLHTCEKLLTTNHGMRAMNCPDAVGRLPLHVAVEQGHVQIVKLFLEKGCVFRKCHIGNTPLHYVAIGGSLKICRILLETNPSLLNQVNLYGMTAMHYAARENNDHVLNHLLTAKASIVADKDGLYFVTYAMQRRNYEAMRVIVMHPRWSELHKMLEDTPQSPVDGFIRDMPSVCKLVMDRCIKETGSANTKDIEISYDFSMLQRPLKRNEPTPKDPLMRMKLMVELQRKELLIHPLCSAYLKRKWQRYGFWVQLLTSTYYSFVLAAVTTLVLGHSPIRHVDSLDKLKACSGLFFESSSRMYLYRMLAILLVTLTVIDLIAKLWQLFAQRLAYFKDWNNYLEFLLNFLAMTYSSMTLTGHLDHYYVGLGVIVMFMAWFNFLLQMMRFNHVGIFVVMFLNVFATVGKCLVVFSIVFIAFALSFHVLFRVPSHQDFLAISREKQELTRTCFKQFDLSHLVDNNTANHEMAIELQSFQYLGLSLFKTLMMMLGEYEHTATIVEPLTGKTPFTVHYPAITFFFYVAFVFLVPIILMNLLIGLAVGDIENVRRSAVHRLIAQQVYWLGDLEPKLTAIFRSSIYQANWSRKPKRETTKLSELDHQAEGTEVDERTLQAFLKESASNAGSLDQQMKIQESRIAAIIDKLGIKTREFTMDEGVYPGELLSGVNVAEESGKKKNERRRIRE